MGKTLRAGLDALLAAAEGLNAAPLLLAAPHPLGLVARDELRGSGGFEAQWPTGVAWAQISW